MLDDPIFSCTSDIDHELLEAVRDAWAAEGINPAVRRASRKTSNAALERLTREHPELVDALVDRYRSVGVVELSKPRHYLGLWMLKHHEAIHGRRPQT